MSNTHTIRNLTGYGRLLQGLLMAAVLCDVGLFIATASELYVTHALGADPWMNVAFAAPAGLVAVGSIGVAIAAVITSCFWIARAMSNLHATGSPDAEMAPAWAVGWYFVPFACLWKPFEGMRQIWNGSQRVVGEAVSVPAFLRWWWSLWLATNVLSNLSFRLGTNPNSYQASLVLDLLVLPLSLAATLLFLKIVRSVTAWQSALRPRHTEESGAPVAQPAE